MSKVDRFVLWQVAIGAALLCAGLLGLDRLIAESLRASGQ